MLTLGQLRQLPIDQQASYVWDHGNYSGNKVEGIYTIVLYWMGNFWAEVIYNNEVNQVEDIILKEAFHNN